MISRIEKRLEKLEEQAKRDGGIRVRVEIIYTRSADGTPLVKENAERREP